MLHPDYGYPPRFRWRVAIFAAAHGVNEAQETFDIHRLAKCTIKRWVKCYIGD